MPSNLVKEEEFLHNIASEAEAVMAIKAQDGRFVFVNDQFAKMFGVSREEATGKKDADFQEKELVDQFRKNDLKVAESGSAMTFKEEVMVEGHKRTFISHKFPMTHLAKYPQAVGCIAIEVTDLQ